MKSSGNGEILDSKSQKSEYYDVTGVKVVEYHHYHFVPKTLDEQIGFWYGYDNEELPLNASKGMQEAYAIGCSYRRRDNDIRERESVQSEQSNGNSVAKNRQDPLDL